ncbi:MAG TPA: sigma-70 family RNA polymerase sigma factor [Pyrinomonadaceae bacterium]|nr:sigma-70 family RNA polymerase sigma factor [Pyrinomonadaceae bacterium]
MRLLQEENHDALALLFDRHHRLVLHVASKILRDTGEAEDLMQEVFFEIFQKACSFDPKKGSAKTWILQYAYHRSLDRRHYLRVRQFYNQTEISDLNISEPYYSLYSWNGLSFQEWARILKQGIVTLNEKQRRTIELGYFQGLELREIATAMDESLPNVRNYYYRGIKKLRDFMRSRSCFEKKSAHSRLEAVDARS